MNENLISIGERTTEEQRKITSKGGKASGETRRKKKFIREIIDDALCKDITLSDGTKSTIGEYIYGIELMKKAKSGDIKAMELIAKLNGEHETKVNVSGDINASVGLTHDEAYEKIKEMLGL